MTVKRTDPTGPGTVTIMLTATSVVLLTVGISTTAWWITGRPTSEWPEWVSAGATVAAVGAAIVAGFYAARAFGLEFARERRWEESQRSAQASLVAAWWGESPEPPPARPGTVQAVVAGPSYGPRRGILLRNASEVPVTEVDIVVRRPDTGMQLDSINVGLLPPATEPVFQTPTRGARDLYAALPSGMVPEVVLYSTDAAGQRWERQPSGALRPSDYVGPRTIYNLAAEELLEHRNEAGD